MSKFKDITKEQITKWKQTKGKLKEISIPIDGEVYKHAKFIICKPTRNVLSAIQDAGERNDSDKVEELLMKNCVLGGDTIYSDVDSKDWDSSIYLSLMEAVGKFMETRKVKSKFI